MELLAAISMNVLDWHLMIKPKKASF